MALGLISASVTATHRLHHRRTRRITATPGTTFTGHVTLLTNADADLSAARVVTYETPNRTLHTATDGLY